MRTVRTNDTQCEIHAFYIYIGTDTRATRYCVLSIGADNNSIYSLYNCMTFAVAVGTYSDGQLIGNDHAGWVDMIS